MQADVEERRPVCFVRHFPQCFSRFLTLEFSSNRHHSWPSPDDPPTVWTDPGPKLSTFSESLGRWGYTKVAIESGVRNEHRNSIFPMLLGIGKVFLEVPNDVRQIRLKQPIAPQNSCSTCSGLVLDDQVLADYRKIYLEITRDFEEAKRDNDHARVAELEKQGETFSAEIKKATGLGGRKREQSDSERVRKNVSNAVTRAIDAVALELEQLGKHLRNAINSGSAFSYDPERDPQWLV